MKFAYVLLSLALLCAVAGMYCLFSGLVPPRLTVLGFEVINPLFPVDKDAYALARGACLVAWILGLFMLLVAIFMPRGRRRPLTGTSREQVVLNTNKFLPRRTAMDRMRERAARI